MFTALWGDIASGGADLCFVVLVISALANLILALCCLTLVPLVISLRYRLRESERRREEESRLSKEAEVIRVSHGQSTVVDCAAQVEALKFKRLTELEAERLLEQLSKIVP